MRNITIKWLLVAFLFVSTQVSAEIVLLDKQWNPVKDKKSASYYLKQQIKVAVKTRG